MAPRESVRTPVVGTRTFLSVRSSGVSQADSPLLGAALGPALPAANFLAPLLAVSFAACRKYGMFI
jgi:hypothetical protein